MHCIEAVEDFEVLFNQPFQRKKIIYSLSSDFFRDGNNHCKLGKKQLTIDIDDEQLLHNSLEQFPCQKSGCPAMFKTVHDYEIHYGSVHRIVCTECKRNFPTYNLLDAHITEKHDSFQKAAEEKNLASYNCFVEGCSQTFSSIEMRNEHVIIVHQYPADFRFQPLKQSGNAVEDMEVTHCNEESFSASSTAKTATTKKVPKFICFGRGSQRTFSKKRTPKPISMKELADAL